jgi:putative transposase
MRHTTFRFALAPTPSQAALLARHAGASRFAYHQSLRLVTDALAAQRVDPHVRVPWSAFDLINAFNAWKRSEAAGRVFAVASDGTITKQVIGIEWRGEVCAQVFEEAAVDLGRALGAYAEAKGGRREGRIGFPRQKRKGRCRDSFRLRNRTDRRTGRFSIRVGDGHPRSVAYRGSARSGCTTTLAGCGGCSAPGRTSTTTPGSRFLRRAARCCLRPSAATARAGM